MIDVKLTPREREVLTRLELGETNAQIALHLHLGARTVESHIASMFAKTATHGRTELLYFCRTHGLSDR